MCEEIIATYELKICGYGLTNYETFNNFVTNCLYLETFHMMFIISLLSLVLFYYVSSLYIFLTRYSLFTFVSLILSFIRKDVEKFRINYIFTLKNNCVIYILRSFIKIFLFKIIFLYKLIYFRKKI